MRLVVLALSVGPSVRPSVATAQEPVRAHVMGDPLPGRDAPAFSLPYVTMDGPGPADQPFALRAELGRVVVLAFVPRLTDSAATSLVRAFSAGADSLVAGDVVVVAVAPLGVGTMATVARERGIKLKLLADSAGTVRRLYGVSRGSIAIYVMNPLGRIVWRDLELNPFAGASYKRIRDAVTKARSVP